MAAPTLDSAEIRVGLSGHIYVGPVGTTAPTDAVTAPAAGFQDLGFASEDALAFNNGKETLSVKGWQSGGFDLRRWVSARAFSVTFGLLQWSTLTLPFALGGGTITGSSPDYHYVPPSADSVDERALICDVLDGVEILRIYISRGNVSDDVASNFVRTAAALLPITFAATQQAGVNPFEWFIRSTTFSAT